MNEDNEIRRRKLEEHIKKYTITAQEFDALQKKKYKEILFSK